MALDPDKDTENRRSDDGEAHDHEGGPVLGSESAEGQSERNGTCVAAGTDNSGNGTGCRGVDVGDDTIGGSLGALDEDGEEDHDEDGYPKTLGVGEDKHHDSLKEEKDSLDPKATAHAILGVELVG